MTTDNRQLTTDTFGTLCAIVRGDRLVSIDPAIEREIVEMAADHGVAAIVARSGIVRWSPDASAALRAGAIAEVALEGHRRAELVRLIDALHAAGVRALVLKGAHLAYSLYADPADRPRRDVDLLIPAGSQGPARRVLESLGYISATEPASTLASSQFHYEYVDARSVHHFCDVHQRVVNALVLADALGYEEIDADAQPIEPLGRHARGPSTLHALIVACMHRALHHFGSDRLIWLCDIDRLVRRLPPPLVDRFLARIRQPSLRLVCADGVLTAAERLGTPLTRDVRLTLETLAEEGRADPAAVYLAGRVSQIDVLVSDLRALGSWRERSRLLREHILPPREYIRTRYGRAGHLMMPLVYVYRVCRGMPRWLRAASAPGR